ncbi:YwqI/YxiC family protein [Halalkalibacter oceani]|uniref:YwqI/YxiC family protein n=1 Tax=Halalkalibacter oceani TaxID=1653776 RepID=A0A9X2DSL1_9BACI|nr:YwqI/YxiC family protein [Halalkalibacter oceani]MCM3715936.1 YwqI/YxiC family protein [Halalkalibacter oceani]
MSGEIKILYSDVEQELAKVESAVQQVDGTYPSSIGEGNVLDVVTRLNELSTELQLVIEQYQMLVLKNIESTRQSLEVMRETDHQISSSIR